MMSEGIEKKASVINSTALGKLSINPQLSKTASKSKNTKLIVESWEDENILHEEEDRCPVAPQQSATFPSAPPPTPISPSDQYTHQNFENPYGYHIDSTLDSRSEKTPSLRPDKTDAIAKRLISGALKIRQPKKTDEQKAYEEAMMEKEINRRNKEKQASAKAQEDTERAKQAVWND